jgi:hypothetical protein
MRLRVAMLLGAALWMVQGAAAGGRDIPDIPDDATAHLRYQRALQMPPGAAGEVCAVLDARVFAHMASRSGDDLRVYQEASSGARDASSRASEIPFTLMESEVKPGEAQPAAVKNVAVKGDTIDFDLEMPPRPYTAVVLQLAASDFVAVATVTGSQGPGGPPTPMGSFTLFDLTREHLARSTELALQESRFAVLHVALRLYGATPAAAMVQGATVPPSREAQTLYTVVAVSNKRWIKAGNSLAEFTVPPHVPVEQVRIVLDPGTPASFLRAVWVVGRGETYPPENVDGEIWSVTRAAGSDGAPAFHADKLAVDAVLGSNLRGAAKVTVAIKNNLQAPLPIKAVLLEMRQRSFCFQAEPGARYTLRYGDSALHAPVYIRAALGTPASLGAGGEAHRAAWTVQAVLGPEQLNLAFQERAGLLRFSEAHPEAYGIGLLLVVMLLGTLVLHRAQRERKKG